MSARILLTTTVHWPSSARLLGAFAGTGASADALLPAGHVAGHSRFLAHRHFYDPMFPRRSLARAIAASAPDLVIPCDDRALGQLLKLADRFPQLIERSLGRLASYPTLVARHDFLAPAGTLRIAPPNTLAVGPAEDFLHPLAAHGRPSLRSGRRNWGAGGGASPANPP